MSETVRLLAQDYALHVFHWLWQSTLVAAVALAVVRLAPHASARFRSAVLGLALCKLCLPPMLPAPTGLFSRLDVFGVAAFASPVGAPSGLLAAGILGLALVHGLGAAHRLGVVWRQHRLLRRPLPATRRLGRARVAIAPPGNPICVPVTFGFWRPAIVLPAAVVRALRRRERRIVFAHERRHIERFHGLAVVVEEVMGALGWIHPLFRAVIVEHRRVREELCDADAVRRLGVAPAQYASCLLVVAGVCGGRTAPRAALAATASAAALRVRIAALGRRVRWSTAEVAAAIVLWTVLLPGIRPWPAAAGGPATPAPAAAAPAAATGSR